MYRFYNDFVQLLDNEDKKGCLEFILEKLKKNELTVKELYIEILEPALKNLVCSIENKRGCIWQEHVRSSIARTVIECSYPFVAKEKVLKYGTIHKGKVLVFCPSEEYHEIGARIVSDFFELCGYKSIFVGANTPVEDIYSAIEIEKPNYVAISVTNYYNIVSVKKTIDKINLLKNLRFKVLVGGNAFLNNPELYKSIGADKFLVTYHDIEDLDKEVW